MRRFACLLFLLLVGATPSAIAGQFGTTVEMRAKNGATFYVPGLITGLGAVDWMVDTGSGYMTINEDILALLKENGLARFVRRMRGRMADGSELEVPVYSIDAISIGDACWLRDVEVAVFPGNTRPILGLNVLQRTAPFIFSFEPPRLVLSHCDRAVDTVAIGLTTPQE
ncbi:MAG: retropepsin-like aspartic protease [Azoarcus sp.]|nr:retropepsin-like aspartic protease [Azoarcus sp.]